MKLINTTSEYGIIAKLFHWSTFLILIVQIPLGFYFVSMDFSDKRIVFEDFHIMLGLIIFYITLFRLIFKIFNQSPKMSEVAFFGQRLIASINHILLYASLLSVTVSGILKKIYNGEKIEIFLINIKIKTDFDKADLFYDMHIISNYLLITLLVLHILAVIFHKIVLKDNILKKMI
tara:strand:+ start:641 stop:1168 length:528 start_codon:yes stop_codon:yes gene_type:complete